MQPRVNTLFDPRPEATVECACIKCNGRFGMYVLEAQSDDTIVPTDPAGRPSAGWVPNVDWSGLFPVARPRRLYWEPRYGSTRRRKGPRTGTGLHLESFGGRLYLRVICKRCRRNEKLGRETLDAALFDAEGRVRLRDGVLYL